MNNYLQKKKSEALDIITKLDERGTLNSLNVFQIKELVEKNGSTASFTDYTNELINRFMEANRIGTARAYRFTLSVLKTWFKDKDIAFTDINPAFLVKFETAHLKKGYTYGGLKVYYGTIRAIFNYAIKEKIIERDLYPFESYEIKGTKTRKRAIKVEAIKRIQALVFTDAHPLYHARNYFLISFYLRGMSFMDLAHLKLSNIIDGRIYYQRQKTDKPYNIKITDEIKAILDLYTLGKTKGDFIFPIIDRTTPEGQYKDVEWARRRFNDKLRKIAELCEIEENLTSYVSRHSFATRAKNLGIPIANISEMLGHENIKTTEIYLGSLPSDEMDKFHEQIIK